MDHNASLSNSGGIGRRRLLTSGGLAAAGVVAGAKPARAGRDQIPPDTRPGGAFDRYVAKLAADGKFSGVVLLAHRGRTVLSRSYGMADKEKGIRNHEGIAFNLSSASQPFLSVAVLQLLQQGRLTLSDPVGQHLKDLSGEIAEKVTIHHLLTSTSGLDAPMPDWQRVFHSRQEVHDYTEQWARQATLVEVPGAASNGHRPGGGVGLAMAAQIVEAVSGMTFWDYVHRHVFRRCGMTGSAFYTREQWLTEKHIAHPYMLQADGSLLDAVRNLDKGSVFPPIAGRNPGRGFIGHASGGGFATAPDLVRFAEALRDGTVLDRPYADLFAGAKLPGPDPTSFHGYTMPISISNGQWVIGRGGADAGIGANWSIYPDTGWVGVVLSNDDNLPIQDLLLRQEAAITGAPVNPPSGGGG
ncbi:serine hydrolase domain-containing protein [Actinoplanes sp. CA-051413]|uniref:serine hydrolase domain-containing protein n=1 Tax=Actinoplanes sp. CA-051413 TaxID=3239899 RepID=UPI003D958A39